MTFLGSALTVVPGGAGYAVAVGTDGLVWYSSTADKVNWTAWLSYGNPSPPEVLLNGPVAVCTDANKVVRFFATGRDANLYTIGLGEQSWVPLGAPTESGSTGNLSGGPGAVLLGTGCIWAFAIGTDGNLYVRGQSTPGGSWSAWGLIGTPSAGLNPESAVGVTLNASGQPEVCATGKDGLLYNIWYVSSTLSWSSWNGLGQPIIVPPKNLEPPPPSIPMPLVGPTALANVDGTLYAFATGADGALWYRWQTEAGVETWSDWTGTTSAPGGLIGSSSLGALGITSTGEVDIGAVGNDGNFYVGSYATEGATWGPWSSRGQPVTASLVPLYMYSVAQLRNGGSIDLGNAVAIGLDGNSAFSVGGWIRPLALPTSTVILQKGSEFTLGTDGGGQLYTQLGSSLPLTAPVNLELDQWIYVLVTFAPSGLGNNTGDLALYVGGDNLGPAVSQTGIASTSANFVLGGGVHAQFLNFAMWSTTLSGSDLKPMWGPPVLSSSLVASYSFSDGVAADLSGHNNPIIFSAHAAKVAWLVPSLVLDGISYASTNDRFVNPGGGGDPFTVSAWVYPIPPMAHLSPSVPHSLTVLANGAIWDPSGFVASLAYSTETKTFTWTIARGGPFGTVTSASNAAIPPEQWTHVAATYDGANLTLYVNGVAYQQAAAPAIPANTSPLLTVGAVPAGAGADMFLSFFTGGIQALNVWNKCLSSSDVVVTMTTDPSALRTPGCTGFYRLGLAKSSVNGISGAPMGLFRQARLDNLPYGRIKASPARGAARRRAPRWKAPPSPSILDLLTGPPNVRETRPTSKLLPSDAIDLILREYERVLEAVPEDHRARYRDMFEQNFYRGLRLQESANGPTPGMVRHVRKGDEVIFHLHTLGGPVEIARFPSVTISPLMAWKIELAGLCVGVAVSFVGLGFAAGSVYTYLRSLAKDAAELGEEANTVWKQLNAQWSVLWAKEASEESQTSVVRNLMSVLSGLYQTGVGCDIAVTALAGTSWWSFWWNAAQLVLTFISIAFGFSVAYWLAQLGYSIAQVAWVAAHPPETPIPELVLLSPNVAPAGGPAFELGVAGGIFAEGAALYWNGSERATTFVKDALLNAQISASDIAQPGTMQVTVTNPGSDPSNALPFKVQG
ncbi:MAG TPA: LamG-like jellyroll fold domain-containing protein [Thermoanaerobaculia bacterium]|nr:LamG-like jellyroll fold domain-containing protein [Thermoanaerobaculia bacterium]